MPSRQDNECPESVVSVPAPGGRHRATPPRDAVGSAVHGGFSGYRVMGPT